MQAKTKGVPRALIELQSVPEGTVPTGSIHWQDGVTSGKLCLLTDGTGIDLDFFRDRPRTREAKTAEPPRLDQVAVHCLAADLEHLGAVPVRLGSIVVGEATPGLNLLTYQTSSGLERVLFRLSSGDGEVRQKFRFKPYVDLQDADQLDAGEAASADFSDLMEAVRLPAQAGANRSDALLYANTACVELRSVVRRDAKLRRNSRAIFHAALSRYGALRGMVYDATVENGMLIETVGTKRLLLSARPIWVQIREELAVVTIIMNALTGRRLESLEDFPAVLLYQYSEWRFA